MQVPKGHARASFPFHVLYALNWRAYGTQSHTICILRLERTTPVTGLLKALRRDAVALLAMRRKIGDVPTIKPAEKCGISFKREAVLASLHQAAARISSSGWFSTPEPAG
jgi:hypothetical protein